MIVNSKKFKEVCQTILYAIDTKEASMLTETLELKTNGNTLNLNVTNREYFCSCQLNVDDGKDFKAAVNAKTFLSLISKITTENIDLRVDSNILKVKANGEYKLPLIYNNGALLDLPEIKLGTVTNQMDISSTILSSILINNSKELMRGVGAKPVQNYYYVDKFGAITFTSGACVNEFTLPKDIKILLSDKVVKLFKLFKGESLVKFTLGQNQISSELTQTIIQFKTDKVSITAKMPDSNLIASVPCQVFRDMISKSYPYNIVINRDSFIRTLDRIMIFNDGSRTYGHVHVDYNKVTISDFNNDNTETIITTSETNPGNPYDMILDFKNIKLILDGCEDEYITISFGDSKAVIFKKQTVYDVLPELKVHNG